MVTITIFGKEMKSKNGQKWVKYSYVDKKGKWYQVKVSQKSSLQLDGATGYLKITFGTGEYFVKDGETKNGFKQNDTLWVLELESFEIDNEAKAKADADRKAKADRIAEDLFGE